MSIKIGLHGSSGMMGKAVIDAITRQNHLFSLVSTFTKLNHLSQLLKFCLSTDVIIDFSNADALKNLLKESIQANKKIVICTTGMSDTHLELIKEAAQYIAVLYAPNTSIGANLVIEIAGKISKVLKDYDVEIIDIHHRYKKDSPSGTALAIGQNIAKNRKQNFRDKAVFDRINKGPRKDSDISFSSLRSGGIYGKHEVIFAGSSEVVTVGSESLTRNVFAEGALLAAKWLDSVEVPGIYSMSNVLNI